MAEVSYEYLTFGGKEVIIRKFVGKLTIKEVADSFKYLIDEGKITDKCKGIVNDLTFAHFNPKMRDFKSFLKIVYATPILRKLKLPAVVLSAERNAFPFIVKLISGLNAQPFRNTNDAIDWILE
ncbi:MAG: hypothetical protein JXA53_06335 [Bacteroidales bacterium]|nr:hypothetical protein [Bacteroidales bacterium]